ncbi:anti-sigma factor [Nocardioides aurantiacus]|uniref:Anti-sigma-K factor rskA n=1 Tax=Nocardioides aurantiacus TaxID=86796 RepID=A0A3N2CVD6_9ACTN|nr:anti-sigma factor [Nocardioides aurantiacus]ROR91491.1 anti-sigma-K factor rskA [Nocardioides aurantiacus]
MTTHLDDDDLAAVALGDHETELPPSAWSHAESCAHCATEVEALQAVVRRARATPASAPPVGPGVWRSVEREIAADDAPPAAPAPGSTAPRRHHPRRRGALRLLAGAAALVLAAGAGLAYGRTLAPDPPRAQDQVVARADLTTVDGDASRGRAQVVRADGALALRISAADLGDEAGWHEVWLLHDDGRGLVSLGTLGGGESGTFPLPGALLREGYTTVDVSLEDDGDPAHSGRSLARGRLGDV